MWDTVEKSAAHRGSSMLDKQTKIFVEIYNPIKSQIIKKVIVVCYMLSTIVKKLQ